MNRRLCFVLLLILALSIIPVQPQPAHAGGDWFSYVYNSATQELLRVHLSGQADSVPINFGEAANLGAYEMTFSPDGTYLAYCYIGGAADGTQQATLVVWRMMIEENTSSRLYQINLGQPVGCHLGQASINSDNTLLAVGLVNYFAGDPAADTTLPPWSLQVLDLNTGELRDELNQTTEGFTQAPGFENTALMPDVVYFNGDLLVFRQLPWGTGGAGITLPAYSWNVNTGSLTSVDAYGAVAMDVLQSAGEIAWIEQNPDLPLAEPPGPMPQANVVKVSDKTGNPPTTVYTNGDAVISDVEYIDGGQRLAIQLTASLDAMTQPDANAPVKWIAVDRQGQVTDLETNIYTYSAVAEGPEGYLFFLQSYDDLTQYTGSFYSLEYVLPDRSRSLLWQSDGETWELAWAMSWDTTAALSPFPAVTLP